MKKPLLARKHYTQQILSQQITAWRLRKTNRWLLQQHTPALKEHNVTMIKPPYEGEKITGQRGTNHAHLIYLTVAATHCSLKNMCLRDHSQVPYCCIATVSWPSRPRLLKMHLEAPRPKNLPFLPKWIKASVTHGKMARARSALLHDADSATLQTAPFDVEHFQHRLAFMWRALTSAIHQKDSRKLPCRRPICLEWWNLERRYSCTTVEKNPRWVTHQSWGQQNLQAE